MLGTLVQGAGWQLHTAPSSRQNRGLACLLLCPYALASAPLVGPAVCCCAHSTYLLPAPRPARLNPPCSLPTDCAQAEKEAAKEAEKAAKEAEKAAAVAAKEAAKEAERAAKEEEKAAKAAERERLKVGPGTGGRVWTGCLLCLLPCWCACSGAVLLTCQLACLRLTGCGLPSATAMLPRCSWIKGCNRAILPAG